MSATMFESPAAHVEEVMSTLTSIDLSMVKRKLMDEDEGQGWTEAYAGRVELLYRRYLCMLRLFPAGSIVPTKDIDLFWHQHILDTRAYAEDCQRTFGYFVHHFPYFGMRGDDDAQDLRDSFEETKALYAGLFGETYGVPSGQSDATTCHKCSSTCHKCTSGCKGITCTQCKSR